LDPLLQLLPPPQDRAPRVALAGAAADVIDGGEPSFSDGVDVAWTRLGGIAGWAGYSIFVALVLGFFKSIRGLRWLASAAEVAWSFATIFVVPLIALEGLDSASARQRSYQLAKENWRAESGGLGALQAALLLPGLLFYLDRKLLFSGHVHSPAGKALLAAVLLCGFGMRVAVRVIRQVFAVSLYRVAPARVRPKRFGAGASTGCQRDGGVLQDRRCEQIAFQATAVAQILSAWPLASVDVRLRIARGTPGRRPPRVLGYGSVTNRPRNARACGASSR
jgi:hypothetical protein